jgi:hypothetical protein
MRIDSNPMQPVEAHYVEPSIVNMVEVEVAPDDNFEMVEAAGGFDTNINMVEIADDLTNQNKVEVTEGFDDQKKMETTEGFDKKDDDNIAEDVVDRQGANWDCLGQPSGKYDYLAKYTAPASSRIDINAIQPTGWGDLPLSNNEKTTETTDNLPIIKKKVTEDLTIENKATEGLDPDQMRVGDVSNCVNIMGPFNKEVAGIKAEAMDGPMKPVTPGILRRVMEDPRRNSNKCCCKHGPRNISWCCCPEKEFDQIPRDVEVEEERLIKKMNELSIVDGRNVGVNMVEVSQRNQAEVDEDHRR